MSLRVDIRGELDSRASAGRVRGFTLVELLVVIAIISILAGLSTVGLQVAQRNSEKSSVRHDISLLRTGIESFAQELGDYPPSTLAFLEIGGDNGINSGNECLFACLETRKSNGPFVSDIDESKIGNTDADKLPPRELERAKKALDWVRQSDALLELHDIWGSPFVYIHHRDYGKQFTYRRADGTVFTVEAAKSEHGGWAAPSSFQLWSIGPDLKSESGGGDDICSWKS